MFGSYAVAMVYQDQARLVHELALFIAQSPDEAEGLAMHDVVVKGAELISLLAFPSPVNIAYSDCHPSLFRTERLN